MRKFFIFKINKEMAILAKNNPYNLYRSLEQIYKMKKSEIYVGSNIYEQLINPINIKNLNNEIFAYYKHNDYYSKVNNKHIFYNKYRPEDTKLTINNSYLIIESDATFPTFFKFLNKKKDYLACDFENKDYFWIDELILCK